MKKLLVLLALVVVATCQEDNVVDENSNNVPDVDENPTEDWDPDNMIIDPGFEMPTVDVDDEDFMPIDADPELINPELIDPAPLERNHPKLSNKPNARAA